MMALTGLSVILRNSLAILLSGFAHHSGINEHDSVIANNHRDVGHAVANGNVDVVGHFDDLFLELFVLFESASRVAAFSCTTA